MTPFCVRGFSFLVCVCVCIVNGNHNWTILSLTQTSVTKHNSQKSLRHFEWLRLNCHPFPVKFRLIYFRLRFQRQLQLILETDALREPSTPIAVLTSMIPAQRCQEEQCLKCLSQRNAANLSLIRDALFVVAIDPNDSPRTANEAMFALHSGNFVNRWYDKSVQLIVFGNGVAGFVNNYLAGMTGTVGTNFVRIAVGTRTKYSNYN